MALIRLAFFAASVCILQAAHNDIVPNVIVGGAGPVGIVFALRLLEGLNNSRSALPLVKLYDPTVAWRRSVIRIPFSEAKRLPMELRNALWPSESIRSRIFGQASLQDPRFSPTMDYEFWPFIEVLDFQSKVREYIDLHFAGYFEYIQTDRQTDPMKKFNYPVDELTVGMACTCGFQGNDLRTLYADDPLLSKLVTTPNEGIQQHAMLVQFQRSAFEPYRPLISYHNVSKLGLTFAASNNGQKAVQIYVYPKGDMLPVLSSATPPLWDALGKACKQSSSIPENLQCNLNTSVGHDLPSNISGFEQWFRDVRDNITRHLIDINAFDSDFRLSDAKLFYADRFEYYYPEAQAYKALPEAKKSLPMFFLGDAAGSTDYALGLSGGRGLIAATYVADDIASRVRKGYSIAQAFNDTLASYQQYWNGVVNSEFTQNDPNLEFRKDIYQKYFLEGRDVGMAIVV